MATYYEGLPGGASRASVGTSAVAIDLRMFIGQLVLIWSDDDDVHFSFAPTSADTTLITSGTNAGSETILFAQRTSKGYAVPRQVVVAAPWLIAAHVTLTGTIRVKPVKRFNGYAVGA